MPITNCNKQPLIICKKEYVEDFIEGVIIYPYEKGIAQFVMLEVPKFDKKVVSYEELLKIESKRGTGALGSSGK